MTIGEKLKAAGGFPAGFDYLRFSLAISVVVWHSVYLCYGEAGELPFWTGWPRPFVFAILPAFFGMGGFLVTASVQRNSIPAFLSLRAARIYPALFCDIIIAAFLLGPLLTTLPLAEYFSHREFWTYLLNLSGKIHYQLPGVFHGNPGGSEVNRQLWTIPYEFISYAAIAGVAMFGLIRRPAMLFLFVAAATLYATYKDITELELVAGPPGRYLVLACLWGTFLYVCRDRIPHSRAALGAAIVAAFALLCFPATTSLSALPVVYIAVWLGTHNPPRRFPVAGADYSYGIYIYGYPIQQTIAYLLPDHRDWYVSVVLGVLFAWLAAFLSWHLVEWPVLRRKNDIVAAADNAAARLKRWLSGLRPLLPSVLPWGVSLPYFWGWLGANGRSAESAPPSSVRPD
jgi:peptidoglycan/LPS O-acetylase OafA/YrhL